MTNSSDISDLVLSDGDLLDNNRWCWNKEVIDMSSLLTSWISISRVDLFQLKRLKISGANFASEVIKLLNSLSSKNTLLDLEIGTMNILQGSLFEFTFDFLNTLSFDQVLMVDQIANQKQTATIYFNAPCLTKIFFGSSSMRFVKLRNCLSVKYLSVEDHDSRRLAAAASSYRNLQFFEYTVCEPAKPSYNVYLSEKSFLFLFQLQVGAGQKLRFHFNSARLTRSTFQPQPYQLIFLKQIYSFIKTHKAFKQIEGRLEVYLNYTKTDFRLPFSCHHLEQDLIQICAKSKMATCPWLTAVALPQLTESLLNEIPELPIQVNAFGNFAQTFPCVQVVHLVLVVGQRPIAPELFLNFLNSCRAIRELRIVNSGFADTVYDQLACLPSVQISLISLIHRESSARPADYRFRFLPRILRLNSFRTDSCSCATMLALVPQMPLCAKYEFIFHHPKKSDYRYNCTVQKVFLTGDLGPDRYHLTIDRFDHTKQTVGKSLLSACIGYEDILPCIQNLKEFAQFAQATGLLTTIPSNVASDVASNVA